jgi:hypothetical protein
METEISVFDEGYPRTTLGLVPEDLTIRMPRLAWDLLLKAERLDTCNPRGHEQVGLRRPSGLWGVRSNAPISARRAVYACARYFRREFGYDFLQYSDREADWETCDTTRAFLWTDISQFGLRIWGACCFRWRDWRNSQPLWALQWIWMHPYVRHRGLLRQAWPYFLRRFGWFDVEPPYSPAVRGFLAKAKWPRPFVWDERDHRQFAS